MFVVHPFPAFIRLQIGSDLSALYIDAIKYKVELLHAIRQERSKSG